MLEGETWQKKQLPKMAIAIPDLKLLFNFWLKFKQLIQIYFWTLHTVIMILLLRVLNNPGDKGFMFLTFYFMHDLLTKNKIFVCICWKCAYVQVFIKSKYTKKSLHYISFY